jgi:hypothetical protein
MIETNGYTVKIEYSSGGAVMIEVETLVAATALVYDALHGKKPIAQVLVTPTYKATPS